MKITDWAVIFILIIGPFLWVEYQHAGDLREVNELENRYTTSLRTAAQDAASVLNRNELQQYESGYGSSKFMGADKEQALSALLQTLSLNFGIADDPFALGAFMVYMPAVVVIDYDGYYIYSVDESADANGHELVQHRWSIKKPYEYVDRNGNRVSFTLDRYVTAYDAVKDERVSGMQNKLKSEVSIPLLQNDRQFDEVRRSVIVRSIENDLAGIINSHNEYSAKLGVHYTFTFPVISQEEWINTLDDVGILVFLQGIPVGDRYYNNYALGGGRLVKGHSILGGTDAATGRKYYFRDNCDTCKAAYQVNEVFTNEKDAAVHGYFQAPYQQPAM